MATQTQNKVTDAPLSAVTADSFELYIEAVQDPPEVVSFLNRLYLKQNDRLPQSIREDFCGTSINCVEWIKSNDSGTAIGIDIDPMPLKWCLNNLLSELDSDQSARMNLLQCDVRKAETSLVDVILSLNSSIFYFKQRNHLIEYLQNAYRHLNTGGFTIIEVYGGPEAMVTGIDRLDFDEFTAIWEQETFNAVTHETLTHLHFEFPDGSLLDRAFTYDWRLWSTSEVIDALDETGFCKMEVYLLKDTPTYRKSDPSKPSRFVEVTDHWSAYIVGWV